MPTARCSNVKWQGRPITLALVGAGEFGATFLAQARRLPDLEVRIVCDLDARRARQAVLAAGYAVDAAVECDSRAEVLKAIDSGQIALVADMSLVDDLPLNVLIEATGDPDAAAAAAERALRWGYYSAMVTKEAEVVVGPILSAKAKERGLVHTLVDGDQPSLLLGLVARARLLGLPIIAAGKSTESDYMFDPDRETVTAWGRSERVPGYARWFGESAPASLAGRRVPSLETSTAPDLCEMAIVANHCNLAPDLAELHAPVARITELPDIFRPREHGGILRRRGVVDVFTCLRRVDEISFAGGVFVVVEAPNAATGMLLAGKGIPCSGDGRYLLLHNPVHLLGVEAPATIFAAMQNGHGTGGDPHQRFDLCARADRDFASREILELGARHTIAQVAPLILPARPLGAGAPIPYYLAAKSRTRRPVKAGTVITLDDLDIDPARALYRLRVEQDEKFGT